MFAVFVRGRVQYACIVPTQKGPFYMLGGPKGGGTPGMRIITPGRKPLAHINPIGGTDMGGGTDETGGDTLYARGPKGEGTPGMHMLLPKMKPPARKIPSGGTYTGGGGGETTRPPHPL